MPVRYGSTQTSAALGILDLDLLEEKQHFYDGISIFLRNFFVA